MEIAFRGPPARNDLSLGRLFKPFLFATGVRSAVRVEGFFCINNSGISVYCRLFHWCDDMAV